MSTWEKKISAYYQRLDQLDISGKVFLVRHISSGVMCVMKILTSYSTEVYQRLKMLEIPGVPRIYECVEDGDSLIVVEEYVKGMTLRNYLYEKGTIPEKQAMRILRALCDILERLHSVTPAIVCRDLKPENIILRGGEDPVIIDFDSGKLVRKEKNDTILLGTPGYAAPEQFGFAASDERTDIYALGVILNEMLTGHIPKEEMATGSCRRIVERCTSMDPEARPNNIRDVRTLLRGSRWIPPGFRTGRPINMILGTIGYLAIGAVIVYAIETAVVTDYFRISMVLLWCLWCVWTVSFLFDYMGLRSKMKFLSEIKDPDPRAVAGGVVWLVGILLITVAVALASSLWS
ncbi:MAG: serine/threonine protein kinase [Lachnospiraceae bacterium]|nr:serine/threonine protein kinase [Lachnospiraceae bacterium]